jgi:hypothetical protein
VGGNRPGDLVVLEKQRSQLGQVVETQRDPTREVVGSEVKPDGVTKSE